MDKGEYLKYNIKHLIKESYSGLGYLRGYIMGCFDSGSIEIDTVKELNQYLKENMEDIIKRQKGGEKNE